MDVAGDARASPAGLGDPAATGKFPYGFAKTAMGSSTAPELVRSRLPSLRRALRAGIARSCSNTPWKEAK